MAAVVSVQVGQCGNQLGEAVLDALHATCVRANVQDTTPPPPPPPPTATGRRPGRGAAEALEARTSAAALRTRSEAQICGFLEAKTRREVFFHANKTLDDHEEVVLEELRRDASAAARKPSRLPDRRLARAVLVDMEPRVVDACVARRGLWRYAASRKLTFEGGSGNNWAQGFVQNGPLVAARCVELLRREAEAADSLGGFLLTQSVAGGTGSGVGSHVTQVVRDEFPGATVANVVVWPHRLGEVVVQNYNAVLTLAELQHTSHGIINLFNDEARAVCQRALRVERPEMQHLNRVLARDLCASTLIPSRNADRELRWRDGDVLDATVRELCVRPSLNCLQAAAVPQLSEEAVSFSSYSWEGLGKEAWTLAEKKFQRAAASLFTFRGKGARTAALDAASQTTQSMRYDECSTTLQGLDKTIACLSNAASIADPVLAALERASRMLAVDAYMHEYARAGLERDSMREALVRVQQLAQDYRAI